MAGWQGKGGWGGAVVAPTDFYSTPARPTTTNTGTTRQEVIAKGAPYKWNQFVIQDKLPDAKTGGPNANVDFLTATAWVDTRDDPIVLTIPEQDDPDRYMSVQTTFMKVRACVGGWGWPRVRLPSCVYWCVRETIAAACLRAFVCAGVRWCVHVTIAAAFVRLLGCVQAACM